MKEGGFASSVPAIAAANIDAWRKREKKRGICANTVGF
jgi:hypothetical protein